MRLLNHDEIILHHNGRENGYPTAENVNTQNCIPKIADIIGRALPKIGAYKKLDNTKQVVALIDDVSSVSSSNEYFIIHILIFRICASIVVNVI
jgi:hypothetical protein